MLETDSTSLEAVSDAEVSSSIVPISRSVMSLSSIFISGHKNKGWCRVKNSGCFSEKSEIVRAGHNLTSKISDRFKGTTDEAFKRLIEDCLYISIFIKLCFTVISGIAARKLLAATEYLRAGDGGIAIQILIDINKLVNRCGIRDDDLVTAEDAVIGAGDDLCGDKCDRVVGIALETVDCLFKSFLYAGFLSTRSTSRDGIWSLQLSSHFWDAFCIIKAMGYLKME